MRRENRREGKKTSKNMWYLVGSLMGLASIVVVITLVMYSNKMGEQISESRSESSKIADMIQNSSTESASTDIGKTVEESQNEMQNILNNTTTNTITNKAETTKKETTKKETPTNISTQNKEDNTKKEDTNKKQETKEPEKLTFIKPVEGELQKGFAKDTLIYSETLGEWSTHLGVDIKADKTTVVKASAGGKVKSIKNDPRYGLSIIIEHADGYQTLYSNLLTAEFVKVEEEVKQGQTIGTVGNTATFEVADAPHLHFEISKDGVQQDPGLFFEM